MNNILIVCNSTKDDTALSLSSYLGLSDMKTVLTDNLKEAVTVVQQKATDLVLLCLADSIVKGFTVLKALREKSSIPIIVLSNTGDESDRIMAFELGCDDFIISPFSYKEISLRVQARIKRYTAMDGDDLRIVFVNGTQELSMDKQSHKVTIDGRDVSFTVSEWKILLLLVENNNSVLSRVQIIESCFGYLSESYDRVVDTHIKNIRSKLGSNGKVWIETVRGYGYCFTGKLLRP